MSIQGQTSQISSEDDNSGNKHYHGVTSDYSVTGVGLDSASVGAVLEKKKTEVIEQKQKKSDKDVIESCADSFNKATCEARQEQMMRFSNGFEFTREEFEEANDKIIKEIEADPAKYAEENGISVAEAMLVLELGKDAKKSGTFDEDAMRAKYGDEIVDVYQGDIQTDMENARELGLTKDTGFSKENPNVDKSANLTDKVFLDKKIIANEGSDELGFGVLEDNSTSAAKAVSPNEAATASMKSDFGQAVNITIADANIPTQEVTIEHQSALTA
ncbi:MAG: hypothetical protein KUG81_02700 [Gammaproteobacteria bacterium]|nr:hypothetical protein [Gammaproteobacteria bacterium]